MIRAEPGAVRPREEHLQAGFAAQRNGDLAAAERWYLKALDVDPLDADALYLLGFLCHQRKESDRALSYLMEAIAQRPQEPLFLKGLGDVFVAAGQRERARELFLRASSIDPSFVDSLVALGELAASGKNLEEAVHWFHQAVDQEPRSAAAFVGMGFAFRDLDNLDGAERCLRVGLSLKPDSPEAMAGLGEVKMKQGHFAEAETLFRRSLALRPSSPQVLNNLGSSLKEQGRPADAISVYLDAYAREPNEAAIPFNLGGAFSAVGDIDNAIRWYDRATAVNPEYAEAHANKSLLLLASADFNRGWDEYRWRFKIKDTRQKIDARTFPVPEWNGEPFEGKTLLIRSEQGAGDMIQFSRYLPLVKARGGEIILETHPRLLRLLKNVEGADRVITIAETSRTRFDLWAPLLNVPGFFTHSMESIPAADTYLSAEAGLIDAMQSLPFAGTFNVGLCWQGNREYIGDRDRSVPLQALEPLLDVAGARFYSLQKGAGSEQLGTLPRCSAITDLGSTLDNGGDGFVETAAVMKHLDLVISTDTAIPHLAGALGRPVWLLLPMNPEWRWFRGGDRSPWYPSMRLFRRQSGEEWEDLLRRVAQELENTVNARQQLGRETIR